MDRHIRRTIFNPRLQELVTEIRDTVKDNIQHKRGTKQLKEDLDFIVDASFNDLEDMRAVVEQELRYNDMMLDDLTRSVASRLVVGPYEREYRMVTKCTTCATSDNSRYRERSTGPQIISVKDYVHEADVLDGSFLAGLKPGEFVADCNRGGHNKKPMKITNACNAIMPIEAQIVHLISSRVKTAGRYCHKFVDRIFYELSDELGWKDPGDVDKRSLREGEEEIIIGKKRALVDRFAFSVIIDNPGSVPDNVYRQRFKTIYGVDIPIGRGGIEQFRQKFRNKYGLPFPANLPFEDLVCYSILDYMKNYFDIKIGRLDDKIIGQKTKMKKGVRQVYKMLQFPVYFKGSAFEGQIKLRSVYEDEQKRKSAFSHRGWAEVGKGLRDDFFSEVTEAEVVYEALKKVFDFKNAITPSEETHIIQP